MCILSNLASHTRQDTLVQSILEGERVVVKDASPFAAPPVVQPWPLVVQPWSLLQPALQLAPLLGLLPPVVSPPVVELLLAKPPLGPGPPAAVPPVVQLVVLALVGPLPQLPVCFVVGPLVV